MRLTPVVSSELLHKICIVMDEPDLLECYNVTTIECQQVLAWANDQMIPEGSPRKLLVLAAGEMDNAADIVEDNYHSCPTEDPQRGKLRYALRSYRGFVNKVNGLLPPDDRVGFCDPDFQIPPPGPMPRDPKPLRDLGHMEYQYDDGGRRAAGFKGNAGDCVCRAVTIAGQLDYRAVYERLAQGNKDQRASKRTKKQPRSARNGIYTKRQWFKDYMTGLGFRWVPTMAIGSGCKVHLRADELPAGRLAVRLSSHYAAVIDGVLHDTYDCSRGGTRCVYGYWKLDA